MRRVLPKTFLWQLVLGTFVVQSVALALFIWYTVVTQRQMGDQHTRERASLQLSRLAAACAEHLEAGDMAGVHEVLELSRIAPTIQDSRLTDLKGNTLAVSDNGRDHGLDSYELKALAAAPREQQIFKIKNGQIEAVTPVWLHDKPVALLWLEPSHSVSLNNLMIAIRIAIDYGLLALLANLLPLFLIVRSMTKPLRKLNDATQAVVLTPDRTGFPLPVTASNEAGELTSSFNRMVRELNEQRSGLLDTLALLDSLLGNAPIGFAFFDHDLRFVRLNDSFANICQIPVRAHIGRRMADLCPLSVARQMDSCLIRVFQTGDAVRNVEVSGHAPTPETTERSWLMHSYPVRTQDNSVRWVGVIAVEITERRKAEEALRKTEKLAAAGRLAASIAHEINNPLESVTNLLYILSTQPCLDPVSMQYVHSAQAELARVSEITQQTLRFYRQSSSPTPTNVAEVLASVLKLYQPRISSAHVSVSTRFRDAPEIFAFTGELRQLFANLIGNALDAMPNGGRLLLSVREAKGLCANGNWIRGVRVFVTDTGSGMTAETLARIFEAFFTTKELTGTGLGLWVSQEIVAKHAGTVRVRSRQRGKSGTTFMLFFPDRPLPDIELGSIRGEAASALAPLADLPATLLADAVLSRSTPNQTSRV